MCYTNHANTYLNNRVYAMGLAKISVKDSNTYAKAQYKNIDTL